MARANSFVDYSETEKPGLYQFKDSSGGSRLLWGTAAEEIKTGIDKGRASVSSALGRGDMSADEWNAMALAPEQKPLPAAGPDERTAELTPGGTRAGAAAPVLTPGGTRSDAVAAPVLTPGGAGAPVAPKGEPVPELTPGQEAKFRTRAPQQARAQAAAAPAPEAAQGQPEDVLIEYGVDPKTGNKTMLRAVWDPKQGKHVPMDPRAPGAIEIEPKFKPATAGTPGGMRPAAIEHSGQLRAPDPGYFEDRWEVVGDQQEAIGIAAQADAAESAGAAQELKRRQAEIFDQQVAEENNQRRIQDKLDEVSAALAQYNRDIDTAQVDPERIYSGDGGKSRLVRHQIKRFFGAFGSTLAKTPNIVAEQINGMIANDIRDQENSIARREKQRDTALTYFRDLTGSLDAAKTAVRKLQTDRAVVQLAREAALARTPKAKALAEGAKAELEKQSMDYEQQFKQQTAGSVTKQFKYVPGTPGRAASGGPQGRRAPSADERADVVKNLGADKKTKPGPAAAAAAGQIVQVTRYEAALDQMTSQLEANLAKNPGLKKKNMAETKLGQALRAPANWAQEGAGYRLPQIIGGYSDQDLRELQDFQSVKARLTGIASQLGGSGTPQAFEATALGEAMARANSYEELMRYAAGIKDMAASSKGALEKLSGGGTGEGGGDGYFSPTGEFVPMSGFEGGGEAPQ